MGSIPNGSAPLQACARQIFKFYASGPHWEGASFANVLKNALSSNQMIMLTPILAIASFMIVLEGQ
jgi:hypothetical protein